MSLDLIRPYYEEFKSMQETLDLFAEDVPLDTGKLKKFGPIKDFWSQKKTVGRGKSTEKRYQKTRTVLIQLFKMGRDPFFLCVLSMSTTTIGGITKIENFYKALIWWMEHEAKISTSFKEYTSQLYKEHESFFTKHLETGERSSIGLEDTPEIERTSYDIPSRQTTPSEDVLMQDNTSSYIQENLPQPSPIRSEDIRPNSPTEIHFRKTTMCALENGQVFSIPNNSFYALSTDRIIEKGAHLVLPGDSFSKPIIVYEVTPETAYHIQRLVKNEDLK
ncbi:hypothetical protein M441DRAFT_63115 [Trichoderma asperellum CBS 433.97]|uniref:Uncharacterized protein n=1 Tax=Trichoderma asperellum (strain ATCC 204424 / CBS 433.97 / NBRC 101777) TaxID=1042311 RepID=A0A2T3YQU6_TRIA4|nr:hypothetical protein M441DRAFT_63115 [Trichoderma asperellum CBS 433.97]PTB34945.1 hypothetical protein M441DRAFT_63115 [Trichoderma asperellum CBS 433.97]